MDLKCKPLREDEFKRLIRGSEFLLQDEDKTLYRRGDDLVLMVRDSHAPGGWWRGVAEGQAEGFLLRCATGSRP